MANGKLGEVFVEIKVDTAQVAPGLEAARVEVAQTTEAIGRDIETKVGTKSEDTAKRIQRSISRVTSAIGSATAAAAAFVGALKLGEEIGTKLFGDWRVELERMRAELDALRQTQAIESLRVMAASIADTSASLAEVNAKLEKLRQFKGFDLSASILIGDKDKLQAQQDFLERHLEGLQVRATRLKEVAAAEALVTDQVERTESAYARIRSRVDEIHGDIARFQNERDKADAEYRQREEQRAKESAERQAAAFASAMERAFTKINTAQTFQQNFAGPLEELLRDIRSDMQTLKFRGGGI